jgi:hypothetical protein
MKRSLVSTSSVQIFPLTSEQFASRFREQFLEGETESVWRWHMPRFWFGLSLILVLLVASTALSQNPSASDAQALALAAKSIAALTGGSVISDVTLTGSVISVAGSDNETGSVTLLAKGTSESRINATLGTGNRSDIRNTLTGTPEGAWINTSAVSTHYASHNCWTDAAWFFPALSSLSQTENPKFVFSYIGEEQRNGLPVQHIQAYQLSAAGLTNSPVPTLSKLDFYLDPKSYLPLAVAFNSHTDQDMNTNIPTEIDFANYQSVNGIVVPFHFQRILNGTVILDVTVTNAVFNTGLADSFFSIQ